MREPFWIRAGTVISSLLAFATALTASAQEAAPPPGQIEEIIVTAQKREQAANSVGMSITAVTGEVLEQRGINSLAELTRLVPGLTIQESSFNSTSFTLRGVGFFNSDLATPPAVTVYVDEAPLPYPAMAKLASFDLARVEVLKGPQGTLFGLNATGGAVQYVAAKPTDQFTTSLDTGYGSFERANIGAFVSGPITDHLKARVAVQGRSGDAWQQSITRPGDQLGDVSELQTRAMIEWRPGARFLSSVAFTHTRDGSESLAAQFLAPAAAIPPLATPGLLAFPVVTEPRAADWAAQRPDTGEPFPYESDTTLDHFTWRNDYALAGGITLTSLTSYASFDLAYGQDPDGTPFHVSEVIDRNGEVAAFFQEMRAAGGQGKVNWLVGANYAHDDIVDSPLEFFRDNDVGRLFESFDPQAFADMSFFTSDVSVKTAAVFARTEYNLNELLMLEGAVRYNADRRTFDNCGIAVSNHFARFWNIFRQGAPPATQVGDCYVVDASFRPVENVHGELNEDSVSWRVGLNRTAPSGLLFYANVSQGYKAGAVPVLAASTVAQFRPVPQESLLAYEVGVKTSLLERRAHLNASVFHYDYEDKQLRGATLDTTFGPLEALVSIPQSHIDGVEAQLVVRPTERLTIDASVTYVKTEIDEFIGFDARANFGDHAGTPFPFSPERQSVTHIDYDIPLPHSMMAFVGGTVTSNSETYSGVGAVDLMRIDSFTLVDLRAGLELRNGRYRVWAWGKNVTDEYYWSNVFANGNAVARFVGQPEAYGLSLSAQF